MSKYAVISYDYKVYRGLVFFAFYACALLEAVPISWRGR